MREICEASLILFLLLSPSLFGCLWPAVNLLISLSSHSLSVQSTNTFSWLDLTCVICRVVSPRVRGHRTSVRLRDDRKVSESLLVLVGCQNMILTPFSSLIYYIRFSLLMLFLLLYLYLFFFYHHYSCFYSCPSFNLSPLGFHYPMVSEVQIVLLQVDRTEGGDVCVYVPSCQQERIDRGLVSVQAVICT